MMNRDRNESLKWVFSQGDSWKNVPRCLIYIPPHTPNISPLFKQRYIIIRRKSTIDKSEIYIKFMRFPVRLVVIVSCVLVFCLPGCNHHRPVVPSLEIAPRNNVYSLFPHHDSIYGSTSAGEIFAFAPKHPESAVTLTRQPHNPLRSIVFNRSDELLALSFIGGLYRLMADSLASICAIPGWSMTAGNGDWPWISGNFGVSSPSTDSITTFIRLPYCHSCAVSDDVVAIARLDGVDLFERHTAILRSRWFRGVNFWTIKIEGALFVAGGSERCVFIDPVDGPVRQITIGPAGNIVWDLVLDRSGTVYCATQRGLFSAGPGDRNGRCIGFSGECLKSLVFDSNGKLWIGRFGT
jgi:hypothetical protein